MRLIDYQTLEPVFNLLPALLELAIARCAREKIHVLENIGGGVPKMSGFNRNAPHQRPLLNWRFYYKATDPAIDQALLDPSVWDPSNYDGDASFD